MEAVTGGGTAVPSYLLTTAEAPPPEEDGDEGGLEDILQVFKIFKLARVLKLARHSPGLQVSTASRAGNKPLLRFHNHREGPYKGL